MSECNNAFIGLADKVEDILSSSYRMTPMGDKNRVGKVASYLLALLAQSMETLTWLNTKSFVRDNANNSLYSSQFGDVDFLKRVSQYENFKSSYDKAEASFKKWVIEKKFQSC